MPEQLLRIALVGAGTLLGKALSDELASSAFGAADFRLFDDEDALGKLTESGDEVTFIQAVEPDSFEGCDFTFFAGSAELTRKHWQQALRAGSRIIDLTGELEEAAGALVRAPWVQDDPATAAQNAQQIVAPDLQTRAVVSAHPVAVLLGLVTERVRKIAPLHGVWVTLLQPASEYGHAALEELHQQTTNLLSFQPLPTEVFGGQTAFSLAVSFGAEGRVALSTASDVIRRHFASVAADLPSLALQAIQAPVFHGYALSVALEFEQPVPVDAVARALGRPHLRVIRKASEFPGNVQAVEEEDVQVLVRPVAGVAESPSVAGAAKASSSKQTSNRFWLWIVADNLKFAARNAVACAVELDRLRPRGGVQ